MSKKAQYANKFFSDAAYLRMRKIRHQYIRNLVTKLVLYIIFTVVIVGGGYKLTIWCRTSPIFNVKNIKILGNVYYTKEDLVNLFKIKTGINIFDYDVDKIEKTILNKFDFLNNVSIFKVLPSTLYLVVKEKNPKANILIGTELMAVDERRSIFHYHGKKNVLFFPLMVMANSTKLNDVDISDLHWNILDEARLFSSITEKKFNFYITEVVYSENNIVLYVNKFDFKILISYKNYKVEFERLYYLIKDLFVRNELADVKIIDMKYEKSAKVVK